MFHDDQVKKEYERGLEDGRAGAFREVMSTLCRIKRSSGRISWFTLMKLVAELRIIRDRSKAGRPEETNA